MDAFANGMIKYAEEKEKKKEDTPWYKSPWLWGGIGAAGLGGLGYKYMTDPIDYSGKSIIGSPPVNLWNKYFGANEEPYAVFDKSSDWLPNSWQKQYGVDYNDIPFRMYGYDGLARAVKGMQSSGAKNIYDYMSARYKNLHENFTLDQDDKGIYLYDYFKSLYPHKLGDKGDVTIEEIRETIGPR